MNSEDFDFSVKGKGHHNKGKTPTKKTEAENSKENQISKNSRSSKKPTTPVVSKRSSQTPKSNAKVVERNTKSSERPKRELRKRFHSEPEELPLIQPEYDEVPEEMEENDEVSSVKLKVKVGYTATGAMIRPPANGGLKKKRRFRNMKVKKTNKPSITKACPKSVPTSPSKRISSVAAAAAANAVQEEKTEARSSLPKDSTKKGKNLVFEPVAGPSGLQKNKRTPRRLLRRKVGDSEDDSEDLDYPIGPYANKQLSGGSAGQGISSSVTAAIVDPLKMDAEEVKGINGGLNGSEDANGDSNHQPVSPLHTNGNPNTLDTASVGVDEVGPMNSMDEPTVLLEEAEVCEDNMQVVVIGDSVEARHNYAKPHAV
jgi:hypothetical protein